jgi:hypothetical protein
VPRLLWSAARSLSAPTSTRLHGGVGSDRRSEADGAGEITEVHDRSVGCVEGLCYETAENPCGRRANDRQPDHLEVGVMGREPLCVGGGVGPGDDRQLGWEDRGLNTVHVLSPPRRTPGPTSLRGPCRLKQRLARHAQRSVARGSGRDVRLMAGRRRPLSERVPAQRRRPARPDRGCGLPSCPWRCSRAACESHPLVRVEPLHGGVIDDVGRSALTVRPGVQLVPGSAKPCHR